jgi:hypothetical protein
MQGVKTRSPSPVIYLRRFDRNSSLNSTNNQRRIAIGNIDGEDHLRGDNVRSRVREVGDGRAVGDLSFRKNSIQ